MTKKIINIVSKNLKRLLRSKTSTALILLGPILLIIIVGLAFNNSGIRGINVGIVSHSNSSIITDFVEKTQGDEIKIVTYYIDDDCISSLTKGINHVCIIFPESITPQNRISMYIDYSRANLAFMIIEIISDKFSETNDEVALGMLETIFDNFDTTIKNIDLSQSSIKDIKGNAKSMNIEIISAQDNIDRINISFPFNEYDDESLDSKKISLSDLKMMERVYRSNLGETKSVLLEYDSQLKIVDENLDEQIASRNQIRENLLLMFDLLACEQTDYVDIMDYIDDQAAFEEVSRTKDMGCSAIYTVDSEIIETTQVFDDTSRDIKATRAYIGDTLISINEVEDENDKEIENIKDDVEEINHAIEKIKVDMKNAETDLDSANKQKSLLKQNLNQMGKTVNKTLVEFDEIDKNFKSTKDILNNITILDPKSLINPVSTQIKPIQTGKTTLDYFFPSMIILIILFVSMLLSSTMTMKEKNSKAYFRNTISPTKDYVFLTGNIITTFILTSIQVMLIMLLAKVFFNLTIINSIFTTSVIIMLLIIAFSLLGIIIAYFFTSEETTVLFTIILSIMLFVFSGMITPLESMSKTMAIFARLNPFVLGENLIRKTMIFNSGITSLGTQFFVLLIELAIFMILAFIITKKNKKNI